jgi:hypothetical protein
MTISIGKCSPRLPTKPRQPYKVPGQIGGTYAVLTVSILTHSCLLRYQTVAAERRHLRHCFLGLVSQFINLLGHCMYNPITFQQ